MAKEKNTASAGTITAAPEPNEPDSDEPRDNYRVKLEIFEGPLDLLLHLIRKNEVDIYDIPIAQITEQYLAYLRLMKELDVTVAADFLVLAATLIYIKSKMLLPPDPTVAGEPDLTEDPRRELVEQLLEHQKYKAAANMLYSRAQVEAACFTRAPLETDKNNPEVAASVYDLLRVFREVLQRQQAVTEIEIRRDEVTMAVMMSRIRSMLAERQEISVREVFETTHSKRELILAFLVFLELTRELEITLTQSQLFGEIIARKRTKEEKEALARALTEPALQEQSAEELIPQTGTAEMEHTSEQLQPEEIAPAETEAELTRADAVEI